LSQTMGNSSLVQRVAEVMGEVPNLIQGQPIIGQIGVVCGVKK